MNGTIGVVASLLACTLGNAVASVGAGQDGAVSLADDPRLSVRVSNVGSNVFLGDLIAALGKSSGVDLRTGSRDGSDDERVCVSLRDVKLADAMRAVQSLVSYRGAEWTWLRDGAAGHYAYTLTRPQRAQAFADRLKMQIQEEMVKQTETLIQFSKLTPDQRQSRVGELTRALLQDDDHVAKSLLTSGRLWAGLAFAGDQTTEEQRREILTRGVKVSIPGERFTPRDRNFVHDVWVQSQGKYRDTPNGPWKPVPEPDSATIYTSVLERCCAPAMFIELGRLGGYAYAGATPMDGAVRKMIYRLWRLPDDTTEPPCADNRIEVAQEDNRVVAPPNPLASRLIQLSGGGHLSLLARLPMAQRDPGSPAGLTVTAFVRKLANESAELQFKGNSGILLLQDPSWFREDGRNYSWKLYRFVKSALKAGGGIMTLQQMGEIASSYTTEQIDAISPDFAVMKTIAGKRDLFALCRRGNGKGDSALLTEHGVPLAEVVERAIASVGLGSLPISVTKHYRAIRVISNDSTGRPIRTREFTFQMQQQDGEWVSLLGFVITAALQPVKSGE